MISGRQPRDALRVMATLKLALALTLALAAAPAPLSAQQPGSVADALGRETPRGTVAGFLEATRAGDLDRAAAYLDLEGAAARGIRGLAPAPQLARELADILDRRLRIDRDDLSAAPDGDRDDGLAPTRELIGHIESRHGTIDLLLERRDSDSGAALWRFSPATLRRLDLLHDEAERTPLRRLMPAALFEISVLGISAAQSAGFLMILLLGWLAGWLLSRIALRVLRPLIARTRTALDDRLLEALRGPLELATAALLVVLGARWLELPEALNAHLSLLAKGTAIGAITWFLLRALEATADALEDSMVKRGHSIATSLLPLGKRTAQVFVGVLGLLFLLENAGFNVSGILAGLGVGGLAVALAAQKTLENFFGGVSLVLDRPVVVGQECSFGDKSGVVEHIGLRSTRVRTGERSLVAIPNATFSTMQIENLADRDRRLVRVRLSLVPATRAEPTAAVVRDARALLERTPDTLPSSRRAHLAGISPAGLDIEITVLIETTDPDHFLARREQILLGLLAIVESHGVTLASTPSVSLAGYQPNLGKTP